MATHPMTGTGRDLIEILRQDHLKVDELFGSYAAATHASEKLQIVQQIYRELMPHAQAEEEIFYPALRDAGSDEAMVEEAYSEHAAAKKTLESILNAAPDDLTYDMKVKMLQKEIQHHVREEETELFQEARDSGLDLAQLGERFLQRKQELMPALERQLGRTGGNGSTPTM
jgi:hemerythrin superfamily protein